MMPSRYPLRDDGTLDLDKFVSGIDPRMLETADGRRLISRLCPLTFVLIYLPHHLKGAETGDQISFSRFHVDMYEEARSWIVPPIRPGQGRSAYIAPRGAGKSTMAFLGLPMWAAAHQHIWFVAAFADSATQSELHLQTFKRELDTNELLRHDFPELCQPMRRPRGAAVSDNRGMLYTKSKFVFAARGIDSSSLGLKVGAKRPDLLLFDDVEPPESNYSLYQKSQRLSTIQDAAFQLNVYARVVMVGTTTMHGSIMHDIVRQVTDPGNCPDWVREEKIRTRYYPAIITRDDGTEASLWPEKWSMNYLQSIRKSRQFAKNYMNQPVSLDGDFWNVSDFRYDPPLAITRRILSIDPAVTSKVTSDFTGLAVIGYDPTVQRCSVEHASQVRLAPRDLRAHVLKLLEQHEGVRAILIESNQGGEVWAEILSPLPVKILTVHQTEQKAARASRVLDYYQSGWVAHAEPLPAFEEQAVAFPNVAHDDVVDAVTSGIHFFLKNRKSVSVQRKIPRTVQMV